MSPVYIALIPITYNYLADGDGADDDHEHNPVSPVP